MMIKHSLIVCFFLLASFAKAEFTSSPLNNKPVRHIRDFRPFVIDFGVLNLINETSDSKSESEVIQDWQNFLSTAPISTESNRIGGQLDSLIGLAHQFGSFKTVIDGEFKLPLLRAMVKTYREDLETLYTLAPNALNGRTSSDIYKDEVIGNQIVVYNCWLIGSLSSQLPEECQYVKQALALNEADAEKLRTAFVRLIRVGSLHFNYSYCEGVSDPVLVMEHDKIKLAREIPKKYVGGFFGPSRELRSIPKLISKLEGPYFIGCGYRNSYPLEHKVFNL